MAKAKSTTPEIEVLLLKEHGDEQLSLEEHAALYDHFGGDKQTHEAQRNRVARKEHWEAKAKTKAKRLAEVKAYDAATAATDKRRPEIEAAIKELQGELSALELAEKKAERAVQDHMQAVEQLRQLVPPHVKTMHDQRRGYINEQIRKGLNEVNRRIEYVETVSGWTFANHMPHIIDHAAVHCPDALNNQHDKSKGINSARWDGFVNDLKAERAELEKERDKLQKQYDAAKKACNEILDFYVS